MVTANSHNTSSKKVRHRNQMAAMLSIIPGLGHLYKGHPGLGMTFLLLSFPFVWIGLIMAFATVGFGLFVPFLYVGAASWHAYHIEDNRKHHLDIF